MIRDSEKIHGVRYVLAQLEERFGEAEAKKCENRRKNRRDKENRSKVERN